jgi:ABC-type dipeptide/oligopeptide/nickel transport systems, permease components
MTHANLFYEVTPPSKWSTRWELERTVKDALEAGAIGLDITDSPTGESHSSSLAASVFAKLAYHANVICHIRTRDVTSMVLALAIVWWPLYARYGRALTLSIKTLPYVDSARLYGMNGFKILLKHVIPNVLPPVFVQISLDLGTIMPTFSTLSFIGFIPNANLPELGFLTTLGLNYIQTAPWTVIFPGLAITVFSLAANLMGEGLRDVFDPRRRSE